MQFCIEYYFCIITGLKLLVFIPHLPLHEQVVVLASTIEMEDGGLAVGVLIVP